MAIALGPVENRGIHLLADAYCPAAARWAFSTEGRSRLSVV